MVLVVIALIALTALLRRDLPPDRRHVTCRIRAAQQVVNDGGALQAAAWTLTQLQRNGPTNPLPSGDPPPSGMSWPAAPGYGFTRSFLTPTGNYQTYAVTVAPDPIVANQWIIQAAAVPAEP